MPGDALYAGGGIGLGPRPPTPEREPYPAPVVLAKDGLPGPSKAAVTGLCKLVAQFGWKARVTYSKGYSQHSTTGRPSAVPRERLAVRMRRLDRYAVAVYVDHGSSWSWDSLWTLADNKLRRYDRIGQFTDALLGPVNSVIVDV